ncbi:hypothetical protein T265_09220 [Opisthorchis viverrini]|uniref:Uncharacterized protein n=1 Tax=Opisthorchis viverrini TaxID=6198 RepID=A0A074Z6F4_OPIVI|nr:hypothetical protein T265_09220 [Opisthorchis viverrini]KER22736.1 hypothetical protein T265_09220 [Opisthorchis viverrini]
MDRCLLFKSPSLNRLDGSEMAQVVRARLEGLGNLAVSKLSSGGMAARHLKGVTAERNRPFYTESFHQADIYRKLMFVCASRLLLTRLEQPEIIPALMLHSGGKAARHRRDATAERLSL